MPADRPVCPATVALDWDEHSIEQEDEALGQPALQQREPAPEPATPRSLPASGLRSPARAWADQADDADSARGAGREVATQADAARQPSRAQVYQVAKGMQNFMYALGDRRTGECVIIDACWHPEGVVRCERAPPGCGAPH